MEATVQKDMQGNLERDVDPRYVPFCCKEACIDSIRKYGYKLVINEGKVANFSQCNLSSNKLLINLSVDKYSQKESQRTHDSPK